MPQGIFIQHRLAFVAALLMVGMGAAYFLWPDPPNPTAPPLPSPNGYDDFVKAGAMLPTISSHYSKMPMEQLKAYVSTNQEPLRLVRLGLTRDCRKPINYTREFHRIHARELGDLKRLAQLVSAEGRFAEAEGRHLDAALSHFDNVTYGRVSPQGGLVIEKLVGAAIESMGIIGIERVAGKLSATETKIILGKMIERDKYPDVPNEFLARDRAFFKKTSTPSERLRVMWEYRTLFPERIIDDKFIEKIHRTSRLRRQLMLRLAAQIYQLEKGSPPRHLSDLVPNLLPTIPVDPGTETNLVLNLPR